jgi:hypothetical protein
VRFVSVLSTALVCALVLAGPALAGKNGHGWAGEVDDKLTTFFNMAIIVIIPLIAVIGTVVQSRLDKRKQRRKAASLRQRSGW